MDEAGRVVARWDTYLSMHLLKPTIRTKKVFEVKRKATDEAGRVATLWDTKHWGRELCARYRKEYKERLGDEGEDFFSWRSENYVNQLL